MRGLHARTGKHSGRNALRTKLTALGFDLAQDQLDDVFKRFKACFRPLRLFNQGSPLQLLRKGLKPSRAKLVHLPRGSESILGPRKNRARRPDQGKYWGFAQIEVDM